MPALQSMLGLLLLWKKKRLIWKMNKRVKKLSYLADFAVMKRETNWWKWPAFSLVYSIGAAALGYFALTVWKEVTGKGRIML